MIRVAGYGRMSTDKQQLSPEVQEDMIRGWFKYHTEAGKWPDGAEFIGMFVDSAVSSRVDMLRRDAGHQLLVHLDPGDVIVCAKYNRAFRSAADAERTLDVLDEAGIKIVFMDMNIDTSTANGKMLAGILASVSKHERDLRSETTAEALGLLRKKGKLTTNPPRGYRVGRHKSLVPDKKQRLLGMACRRMLRSGMSRVSVEKALRKFFRKHHMRSVDSQMLVEYAAAACLDFPKISLTFLEKYLEVRLRTIEFVRRSDHKEIRDMMRSKLKEGGYRV